jgi:predicted amino acid dehydrogenase
MKNPIILLAILLALAIAACRDQGAPIESPARSQPHHGGGIVSGEIVADFVDTVTLAGADSFVRNLGLTPVNFSSYQIDTLHFGIIGVPSGDEQLWVDSLKTYTGIIKDAGRIAYVITE